MITANKLLYYQDRFEDRCRPVTADVFLTDYCNSGCSYCRYKQQRSGAYINAEDFKKYLERLTAIGVRGVILTGGGEPTINPDFDKICTILDDNRVPYGVNTNGIVFKGSNARFVKISIDEGDRETYAYCRGVDKLQDVLLNVEKYCKTQSRIGVQCVARNTEQIRRFYATVKRLPVNYIQFRPIELAHHLEHTDTAAMLDLLEKMKLSDQRIYISYKFSHLDRPKACPAHWAAICVKVNGDVPVCCQRSEEIIGNIMDGDIQQKYADYVVSNFQKCEHPCRLTGANMAISRFDTSEISFI